MTRAPPGKGELASLQAMLKTASAQGKPGLRRLAAAIESARASVEVTDPAFLPALVACLKQAAKLGDLNAVASVLRMVPRDLDEASGRAISACNYANVLAEAFGRAVVELASDAEFQEAEAEAGALRCIMEAAQDLCEYRATVDGVEQAIGKNACAAALLKPLVAFLAASKSLELGAMRQATVLLLELVQNSQRHATIFASCPGAEALLAHFLRTCGDYTCQLDIFEVVYRTRRLLPNSDILPAEFPAKARTMLEALLRQPAKDIDLHHELRLLINVYNRALGVDASVLSFQANHIQVGAKEEEAADPWVDFGSTGFAFGVTSEGESFLETLDISYDNVSVAEVLDGPGDRETELRLQLVAAAEKLPAGSYDPENQSQWISIAFPESAFDRLVTSVSEIARYTPSERLAAAKDRTAPPPLSAVPLRGGGGKRMSGGGKQLSAATPRGTKISMGISIYPKLRLVPSTASGGVKASNSRLNLGPSSASVHMPMLNSDGTPRLRKMPSGSADGIHGRTAAGAGSAATPAMSRGVAAGIRRAHSSPPAVLNDKTLVRGQARPDAGIEPELHDPSPSPAPAAANPTADPSTIEVTDPVNLPGSAKRRAGDRTARQAGGPFDSEQQAGSQPSQQQPPEEVDRRLQRYQEDVAGYDDVAGVQGGGSHGTAASQEEQLSDQTTQPEAAHKAARKEACGDAESSPKEPNRTTAAAAGNAPPAKAATARKQGSKKRGTGGVAALTTSASTKRSTGGSAVPAAKKGVRPRAPGAAAGKGKGAAPSKVAPPKRGGGKRGAPLPAVVEDSEDEGLGDTDDRGEAGYGQEDADGAGPEWLLKGGKADAYAYTDLGLLDSSSDDEEPYQPQRKQSASATRAKQPAKRKGQAKKAAKQPAKKAAKLTAKPKGAAKAKAGAGGKAGRVSKRAAPTGDTTEEEPELSASSGSESDATDAEKSSPLAQRRLTVSARPAKRGAATKLAKAAAAATLPPGAKEGLGLSDDSDSEEDGPAPPAKKGMASALKQAAGTVSGKRAPKPSAKPSLPPQPAATEGAAGAGSKRGRAEAATDPQEQQTYKKSRTTDGHGGDTAAAAAAASRKRKAGPGGGGAKKVAATREMSSPAGLGGVPDSEYPASPELPPAAHRQQPRRSPRLASAAPGDRHTPKPKATEGARSKAQALASWPLAAGSGAKSAGPKSATKGSGLQASQERAASKAAGEAVAALRAQIVADEAEVLMEEEEDEGEEGSEPGDSRSPEEGAPSTRAPANLAGAAARRIGAGGRASSLGNGSLRTHLESGGGRRRRDVGHMEHAEDRAREVSSPPEYNPEPREEVPGACVNDEDIGSLTKRALLSGDRGRGGTRALNPDEADLLPGKQQGRGGGGGGPPAMHWLQDTVLRQRTRTLEGAAVSPITPAAVPGTLLAAVLMTAGSDRSAGDKPPKKGQHSRLRPDNLGGLDTAMVGGGIKAAGRTTLMTAADGSGGAGSGSLLQRALLKAGGKAGSRAVSATPETGAKRAAPRKHAPKPAPPAPRRESRQESDGQQDEPNEAGEELEEDSDGGKGVAVCGNSPGGGTLARMLRGLGRADGGAEGDDEEDNTQDSDAEGEELAEVQAALARLAASKRAAANKKQQAVLQGALAAVSAEHERVAAAAARDREALTTRLTQQYEEVSGDLGQSMAAMEALNSEFQEAMQQLYQQYQQKLSRKHHIKQEAEAAAKKLRSSEKRKQQAYEAFTAQTLQDAQRKIKKSKSQSMVSKLTKLLQQAAQGV